MTALLPGGPHCVAELSGVWLRSLYNSADGGLDEQTQVTWIQAGTAFVDLRQPPGRPWFDAAAEISAHQHCWLQSQQAFAGTLTQHDGVYRWSRELDLQPPGEHPDAGTLRFDGEVLIETGHHADYVEHWVPAGGDEVPVSAARLLDAEGRTGILVRVGADFGWARGRLPGSAEFLDCEFAIGRITGTRWQIVSSSLPRRDGARLDLTGIRDEWSVVSIEGDRAPWQM